MMKHIKGFALSSRLCEVLIFIWALSLMSASLPLIICRNIHWYITALITPFIFVDCFFNRKIKIDLFFISASIFLLSIYPSVMLSFHTVFSLVTFIKLSLIFLFYLLLSSDFIYLRAAFAAFILSVILNCILLFFGFFLDISCLADITGGGRWMTLLNSPGTLAIIGISIIIYSLYSFISDKKISLRLFVLFFSCVILVVFDGSRTCILAMLLGIFYCCILFISENGLRKIFLKKFINVSIAVAFGLLFFSYFITTEIKDKLPFRYNETVNFVENISTISLHNLRVSDEIRYSLLRVAFQKIIKNPIIGGGMYSTGIWFGGDFMDIHNAYLCVWAEFGFISFIAYLFLVFSWLFRVRFVLRNIKNTENVRLRAIGYNAIFLLFFFAFKSLFHPLSNELSDWVLVLVPVGIYWQFAKTNRFISYE